MQIYTLSDFKTLLSFTIFKLIGHILLRVIYLSVIPVSLKHTVLYSTMGNPRTRTLFCMRLHHVYFYEIRALPERAE